MRAAQTWLIADTASSNIEEEIKLKSKLLSAKERKNILGAPKK